MKICLIAGNSPQYVVNLPKEIHRLKLCGIMRKYIAKLISCGITEFYVNAESVIKTDVEEVLGGFNKKSVSAADINCGGVAFGAVIAVWGWGANGEYKSYITERNKHQHNHYKHKYHCFNVVFR